MEKKISFKGRMYRFEETRVMPITDGYVPEWSIYHAIRESAQNAYDEAAIANAEVIPWMNENEFYIRDTGRGVDFNEILHIGASGKRGVDGVVGQHGEGEVISFLAATRAGVTKYMASKDWLATSEFVEQEGAKLLAIHLYKTRKPRKGTGWLYSVQKGDTMMIQFLEESWDRVREEFRKHRAVNRKRERVFSGTVRGTVFSNGLEINKVDGLMLNYDLDSTPGRDRAGFSWSQIKDEVKEILTNHVTPKLVSELLWVAEQYGVYFREFELIDLTIDSKIVQRGAYLHTNNRSKNRMAWGYQDQASSLADAKERGIKVITFQDRASVPIWITANFPNVKMVVSSSSKIGTLRKSPRDFSEAVSALLEVLGADPDHPVEIHSDLGGAIADTDGKKIRFSRKHAKGMSAADLMGTLAHELAHDKSGAMDCTRAHASAIESILSRAAMMLAMNDKMRAKFRRAAVRMDRWSK